MNKGKETYTNKIGITKAISRPTGGVDDMGVKNDPTKVQNGQE